MPAVAESVFAHACCSLHEQGRISGDGGGEVFANPRFGRAGYADEEQGAIGDEAGYCDFHQAAVSEVFGGDFRAVGQGIPEEVAYYCAGAEVPAGGPDAFVVCSQGFQFVGVSRFRVGAEDGGGFLGHFGYRFDYFKAENKGLAFSCQYLDYRKPGQGQK
ncbi:MAG: hypothetical protein ACJAX1_002770 [Neolewinella sp.]